MKVFEILNEAVDITTPKFKQWFANSKVVDNNGPLLMYHASSSPTDFTSIRALSHFGNLETSKYFIGTERGRIFPVYLKITNPIKIPDFDGFHDATTYLNDIINSNQVPEMMKTEAHKHLEKRKDEFHDMNKSLIGLMKKYKYDGFVYPNYTEGKGTFSWIIIDSDQVLYKYSH